MYATKIIISENFKQNVEDAASYGVYVIDRRFKDFEGSVRDLAQVLYDFCGLSRRQRIIMRNRTERLSELLDWRSLGVFYRYFYSITVMDK